MRKIDKIGIVLLPVCFAIIFSGCTLFGLDVQKDYDREPHTLDPYLHKTTWQFLKERGRGVGTTNQIFSRMLDGIEYAEIDSNEYKVEGRTYLLLNTAAVTAVWTNVKTAANKAGTKWSDYPKADVKKYFQYLILQGVHNHYSLPALSNVEVKTLAPEGSFSANPPGFVFPAFVANDKSTIKIKVLNSSPSNTSDYPIQLNNTVNAVTSSLLATNGAIHVLGAYLTTNVPEL